MKLQNVLSNHHINILCITEHWRSSEELPLYTPPGYILASSYCRERGRHGGCAIYYEVGMQFTNRDDFKHLNFNGSFECCASQFAIGSEKYLLICIYRPNTLPLSDIDVFFEKFSLVLDKCHNERMKFIIAGDFNIDLLSDSVDSKFFLTVLKTYDLNVSIFEPTRVTSSTKTCLDNIISNIEGTTTILEEHLSDHSGQKFTFDLNLSIGKHVRSRKIRLHSEENHKYFEKLLLGLDWSLLYDIPENDVNELWNFFSEKFNYSFLEAFHLKTLRLSNKKKYTLTPKTASLKNQLDSLLTMSRYKPELVGKYKMVKRLYDAALIADRKFLNSSRIDNSENKSKTAWNIVREVTNRSKNPNHTGFMNSDLKGSQLADQFNDFFINIPKTLSGNFNVDLATNGKSKVTNSFCLFEVLKPEILGLFQQLTFVR